MFACGVQTGVLVDNAVDIFQVETSVEIVGTVARQEAVIVVNLCLKNIVSIFNSEYRFNGASAHVML